MSWEHALIGGMIGWAYGTIAYYLKRIERNTRPPKPDIKSFITKNTKAHQ